MKWLVFNLSIMSILFKPMPASAFLIRWNIFSAQVAYHTPPRFPLDVIENIRKGASLLFQQFGLQDFARIDGWFLPNSNCKLSSSESQFGRTESGSIIFTDINLVRWFSSLGGIQIISLVVLLLSWLFINAEY